MANPTLAAETADSQDAGGGGRKRQLERRRRYAERLQGQGLLLILAIVIVLMWTQSPYFMTVDNLFTAASVVSILGIMAVAETVLIIAGRDRHLDRQRDGGDVGRDRVARRQWH